MADMTFKLSGSITLSIFASQGSLKSNSSAQLILGLYGFTYILLQLIVMILAYFPEQNLTFYKQISNVNANINSRLQRLRPFQARNWKFLIKINSLTQFLANNQFGFTYSSLFRITKWKVVENMVFNLYLVILFYEKLI